MIPLILVITSSIPLKNPLHRRKKGVNALPGVVGPPRKKLIAWVTMDAVKRIIVANTYTHNIHKKCDVVLPCYNIYHHPVRRNVSYLASYLHPKRWTTASLLKWLKLAFLKNNEHAIDYNENFFIYERYNPLFANMSVKSHWGSEETNVKILVLSVVLY